MIFDELTTLPSSSPPPTTQSNEPSLSTTDAKTTSSSSCAESKKRTVEKKANLKRKATPVGCLEGHVLKQEDEVLLQQRREKRIQHFKDIDLFSLEEERVVF